MSVSSGILQILSTVSYISMVVALGTGCVIILGAMFKGIRAEKAAAAVPEGSSYQEMKAS